MSCTLSKLCSLNNVRAPVWNSNIPNLFRFKKKKNQKEDVFFYYAEICGTFSDLMVQIISRGVLCRVLVPGACPWGLAPPLEIEKQKKKVIRANFKLVHLYLATFLVGNVIFSPIF